jgi:lipopolysaccharide/colanic/teichoic acid biosynthesis glycosyltransferase
MGLVTLKDFLSSSLPRWRDGGVVKPASPALAPIPSEAQFAGMLLRERRRTDRSGKPFLLMLLDIEKGLQNDLRGTLLGRVWRCLCSSIRETDTPGWHKNQAVLGVLFTELNFDGPIPVTEVIPAKVLSALATHLAPEELSLISVRLHMYPDHWGAEGEPLPDLDLYPDLAEVREEQKLSQTVKRAIDIVGSVVALLVLSPLFALIALLIQMTSKGPVLFRQLRAGRYGRRFTLLKFRTMYSEANESVHKRYVQQFISESRSREKQGNNPSVVYKLQDDPRVTLIGRFLRKTSLDELPQFWNVLKGEMSLVGPRPPIPYEVQCYDTWHRRRLLEVKPGITGLWQVYGRSRTKFNDMVRLDLQYAKSWSIWLDLKILFRTPRAVISGDGAY